MGSNILSGATRDFALAGTGAGGVQVLDLHGD